MDGVITAILEVWTGLTDWFVTAIGSVTDVFYVAGPDGGLTFIGGLTILAIAFSVATYIVATVRSYLQMRA